MSGCGSDVDCPGNLICYPQDVVWNVAHNTSFCDCFHELGWARYDTNPENCLDYTVQGGFFLLSNSWICVATSSIVGYSVVGIVWKRRYLNLNSVERAAAFLFAFTGVLSLLIWRALFLTSMVDPSRVMITDINTKEPSGYESYLPFIYIFQLCYILSLNCILMVWVGVLFTWNTFMRTTKESFPVLSKLPFTYQFYMSLAQVVWIGLALLALVLESTTLYSFSVIIPLTAITAGFIVGRRHLLQVTTSLGSSADPDKCCDIKRIPIVDALERVYDGLRFQTHAKTGRETLARAIASTAGFIMVSLVVSLIGAIIYGMFYYQTARLWGPGIFSPVFVARELGHNSSALAMFYIIRYIFLSGSKGNLTAPKSIKLAKGDLARIMKGESIAP